MAFFDNLGKKITRTSQGVMQKTKDAAEVIKLNGSITDEEKNINSLYTKLGETYFRLYGDSCPSELQGTVDEIKAAFTRINEYSQQIHTIKGVTVCPNCGKEVASDIPFCMNCGTKISEANTTSQAEVSNSCTSCGAPIGEGCVFCAKCGAEVGDDAAPVEVAPSNRICSNCKNEVLDDSAFCMNCGTKL